MSIIDIHLLSPSPDDTATLLLSLIKTVLYVLDPVLSFPIWDNSIYYCAGRKGIKMFNLNDKSISNIIKSNMDGVYYVAISGDKLYYANLSTVTCCDLHGTTHWEFNDKRVLRDPFGTMNVRVHGNSCHDFLTFYVYYSYTSIIATSR
jgi:hypothetical protein